MEEQLSLPFEEEKITVVCWKWKAKTQYRSTFTGEHVNTLKNMVLRNTTMNVDFVCITDDPKGIDEDVRVIPLWENPAPNYGARSKPNCFVRLKAFSKEMEELLGKKFVWIDLDAVIVSNIDAILKDPSEFRIWRVDNEKMPCNGSLVLMQSGTREHIWKTFDPSKVHNIHGFRRTAGFIGSDQAWIAQNLSKEDKFFTKDDGVYSYRCHMITAPQRLPPNAKIVFFHGESKPWSPVIRDFAWVKEHYK